MPDMELSSSITARFSTKPCGFCRTNLDAALSVHQQTSTDHQIATRGHDLECGGTEEVLLVESPHPDDAVVPVEVLGGAGRVSRLSAGLGMQYLINKQAAK